MPIQARFKKIIFTEIVFSNFPQPQEQLKDKITYKYKFLKVQTA